MLPRAVLTRRAVVGPDQVGQVYGLHGLRLRSPVPLAGFEMGDGEYDFDLRWAYGGPVRNEAPAGTLGLAAPAEVGFRYAAAVDHHGRWALRVPGLCDFVIDRPAGTVDCRLDPGADASLVALLVCGLVVAFLLALDGHAVLHASAVELDGAAIAFAGPTGAGKSTLAALLCAAGARLIADDVLRVSASPVVACVGGSPQLRLRPRARWALDAFAAAPEVVPTVDDRLGVRPEPAGATHVPLAAVVLPLLSREAPDFSVRRLTGAAAAARLTGVCRVAGWTDPEVVRAQFRGVAGIAAGVPVVEAVVPWASAVPRSNVVPGLLDLAGLSRVPVRRP